VSGRSVTIPEEFWARLKDIVPTEYQQAVREGLRRQTTLTVRVNTLKTSVDRVRRFFRLCRVAWQETPWCPEVLVLPNRGDQARGLKVVERLEARGHVYRQGLSSLLPVVILDPRPGERVLDLCAAPGGKTAQMAARMRNEGRILAVEAARGRYYKLRRVLDLTGVRNATCVCRDGRSLSSGIEAYDKILVDAPCSAEGRFKTFLPETFAYWRPRKIKEMARKQKGLALKAARFLRPGGVMVYATCTFAPEENEGVVDWLLRKMDGALRVEAVDIDVPTYPAVLRWGRKVFHPALRHGMRILPSVDMDAFFVVKLVRLKA